VQAARLVVDDEANRGVQAPRVLEPQLGPAQRLGIVGDPRSEIDEVAADLGQGEDRRSGSAAAPPPACAQPPG
jgi:hypothetical protein